jgi:uncharacterized membrane protein YccC
LTLTARIATARNELAGWIKRRGPELRLSLRMTAAGALAYLLAEMFDLPQGYWAVFTAVLVVQASLGGSLKATLDRLLGTVGGAAYAAIVSSLIPHSDAVALGLALIATLGPLAVLAAIKPSFRVAPVTGIIVLMSATSQQVGPLDSALHRVIEITLGSLVGLGVSLLLLPSRAHGLVADAANRLLQLLAALSSTLLEGAVARPDNAAAQRLHDAIRAQFTRLDAMADEAAQEQRAHLGDAPDPAPLLRTLRRLRHDLVMIGRAAAEPLPVPIARRLGPSLARLSAAAGAFLKATGEALVARRAPPPLDAAGAAFDAFVAEMDGLRADRATSGLSGEAAARIFALGFAIEQLRQEFGDLESRAGEFAEPTPSTSEGAATGDRPCDPAQPVKQTPVRHDLEQ